MWLRCEGLNGVWCCEGGCDDVSGSQGPVFVEGWEERTDCTTLEVPRDCIGYVTGA